MNKHQKNIINIIDNNSNYHQSLQGICDYLRANIDHYDWVGFYFKNGQAAELKLAEYSGEPTEHTIIPYGKGICGQVAISNENLVVQDVSVVDNYISCGLNVKSEIVIPIFVNEKNIGQIDIDSHAANPFTAEDEHLLEWICQQVSELND